MNMRVSVFVYSFVRSVFVVAVLATPVLGGSAPADSARDRDVPNVTVTTDGTEYSLRHEAGTAFHVTANPITNVRAIAVPDSPGWVATWEERLPSGGSTPHYAISLDTASSIRHGRHARSPHRSRRTRHAICTSSNSLRSRSTRIARPWPDWAERSSTISPITRTSSG